MVSFVVGYAAIVWLLRHLAAHSVRVVVGHRVLLGAGVLVPVGAGLIA